jgi:hypothetical protein
MQANSNRFPQETLAILCSPLRVSNGARITPMTAIRHAPCEGHATAFHEVKLLI